MSKETGPHVPPEPIPDPWNTYTTRRKALRYGAAGAVFLGEAAVESGILFGGFEGIKYVVKNRHKILGEDIDKKP